MDNSDLDKQMQLVRLDLVGGMKLLILFEQLDTHKRYSDMLSLIIRYPKTICDHFEMTSNVFDYNLEHEWDWNLKNLGDMTEEEWATDLNRKITNNIGFKEYKLAEIIKKHMPNL